MRDSLPLFWAVQGLNVSMDFFNQVNGFLVAVLTQTCDA
jgi:hypothetical protein